MTEHRLGFAVKVLGGGGLPSHDTRRWQSGPHLRHSLERLRAIVGYLDANDIRMYRVATALAPYASHPELTQFHGQVVECAEELAAAGELVRGRDIRLSSHPGQYTVLNSTDPAVQAAAVTELEVQAALFDAMGLGPEAVVVLHVGGAVGGIEPACDRFLAGFEQLSEAARRRLVIENDDRSFGTADVVALAGRAGLRVVWDVLHHHCNDRHGMSDREAIAAALATWPEGVTPKVHYSSPRLDMEQRTLRLPQLRAHADLVDPIGFEQFMLDVASDRDFDVMLEAKAKDLALLRLREQLAARGMPTRAGRLVVGAGGNADVIRRAYAAYQDSDRAALEPLIADEFSFCSPDDPELDRPAYFERCWPNHEHIRAIRIERLSIEGDEALVRYRVERESGERFRNAEYLRLRDGQIERVEVYYGAPA